MVEYLDKAGATNREEAMKLIEIIETTPSIHVKNNNKNLGYGVRHDPTQGWKGKGYAAGNHTVTMEDGEEVQITEYTVGVTIDGKIVDVPSINAYTTEEDMKAIKESVRTGKPLPQGIEEKAQRHALDRIEAKKSIYLEEGEEQVPFAIDRFGGAKDLTGEVDALKEANKQKAWNVDWGFIHDKEGFKLTGYVPDSGGSNSGVTIASGFDLGSKVEADLKGLPTDIIKKLKPYLKKKGVDAKKIANQLEVSKAEAAIINEFAKKTELKKIITKWEKETGTPFSDLSKEQATVIVSVGFQHGAEFIIKRGKNKGNPMNFWKLAKSGNWRGVHDELMDFGDRYKTRRRSEAVYLLKSLGIKKNKGK